MVRYLDSLDDLAPAGYTVGLHIRFASPLFFRSTYPQDWQDIYAANSYSLRDPLVFWGISKTGRIRWSEITLPDPFGVMQKAARHGLTFGAVIASGNITSRSILGVARSDREFTDAEIDVIAGIAGGLHEVSDPPPRDLAPELIEALRASRDGEDAAIVATRLGISKGALRARLSSARDHLGARTTAEALRMAREYRLF
ncbi:LuxR family transcriptional regulator [Jannaschia formosa]|nr:LuxR family transcriptional regulator [Jannaschia formosa]